MITPLTPDNYPNLLSLFRPLEEHMAVPSALTGRSSAWVYADSPDRPRTALIWVRSRVFLASLDNDQTVVDELSRLFQEELIPSYLKAGGEGFILYYTPEAWGERIAEILPGADTSCHLRQYYHFPENRSRASLAPPEGFHLRLADASLLQETNLKNLPDLMEEMCSERASVAEFLEKSFGVCPVIGNELAGWCLSEYNLEGSCEIGIGVQEAYRRQGLATWMTAAFVDEARRRGIDTIGWDCWKGNIPSVATAKKSGFELVKEYPVYLVILNRSSSSF